MITLFFYWWSIIADTSLCLHRARLRFIFDLILINFLDRLIIIFFIPHSFYAGFVFVLLILIISHAIAASSFLIFICVFFWFILFYGTFYHVSSLFNFFCHYVGVFWFMWCIDGENFWWHGNAILITWCQWCPICLHIVLLMLASFSLSTTVWYHYLFCCRLGGIFLYQLRSCYSFY